MTDDEISDLLFEICNGRKCSECPVRGICGVWNHHGHEDIKQIIIDAYNDLFPDKAVCANNDSHFSEDDLLSVLLSEE